MPAHPTGKKKLLFAMQNLEREFLNIPNIFYTPAYGIFFGKIKMVIGRWYLVVSR
jgi:hypothetical protein